MVKAKRDVGREILAGILELKRGKAGRVTEISAIGRNRKRTDLHGKRAARSDPWETGKLGNDERYARRVSAAEESRIDAALGLRTISIRLPERLIEQLKLIATHRGIGYQPLMRDVLSRFARRPRKSSRN
jgi:hypothetical protein